MNNEEVVVFISIFHSYLTSFWHSECCFLLSVSSLTSAHILISLFWIWKTKTEFPCLKDVGHGHIFFLTKWHCVKDHICPDHQTVSQETGGTWVNVYKTWDKIFRSCFHICVLRNGGGGGGGWMTVPTEKGLFMYLVSTQYVWKLPVFVCFPGDLP